MIFHRKRLRESERFSLRYVRPPGHKRALAASNCAIAAVQFSLGIALCIVSYQSLVILTRKLSNPSFLSRHMIPALLLLGGFVALKSSISRFLRFRSER